MLVGCNDDGQDYRLTITRPTGDAAVIWLQDTEIPEDIWLCNVRFGGFDCFKVNSPSFYDARSAVIGLLEDAVRACSDDEGAAESTRFKCSLELRNAFTMKLEFSFKADEKQFKWVFPLVPENAAAIQANDETLHPICATTEDPGSSDECVEDKRKRLKLTR